MPENSHIIFIHGLANKPPPEDLKRIWLQALGEPVKQDPGFHLGSVGVRATFVYWANRFYDTPLSSSDYESVEGGLEQSVHQNLEPTSDEWVEKMRKHFPFDVEGPFDDAPADDSLEGYERIPLPGFVKNKLMKHFLREAHDYLFNVNGIRDTIRAQVVEALHQFPASEPKVMVGHSQGSIIAYDVLTGVDDCPPVDGFLTLGSPLGVDEIQDRLVWTRENGFPSKLTGDWVNVYDPFDVVSRVDPKLANDFKKDGEAVVIDVKEESWGKWRHSATKYLKGPDLRKQLRVLAGRA